MSKETKTTPLEALAAQIKDCESSPLDGELGQSTPSTEEDAQAAQSMAMVEAGMAKVLMMALKVGRALIARKLPEIKDEWPDDLLEAPASAAVPLMRKHLERVMQVVGSSPEAAALAVACIPLVMGVFSAMDKAEQRAKREAQAAQSANADAQAAAA